MLEHWVLGALFVASFFSVGWLLFEHHRRLRLSHVELLAEINAVGANIMRLENTLEATSSRNLEVTMAAHTLIDEVDNGLAASFGEIKRDLTTLIEDRPKLMQIPQMGPQAPYASTSPGDRVVTWNDLRRAGEAKRQRDLAASMAQARAQALSAEIKAAEPIETKPVVDWKYADEVEPVPATAWEDLPTTTTPLGGTRRTSAMDEIFKQAKENE